MDAKWKEMGKPVTDQVRHVNRALPEIVTATRPLEFGDLRIDPGGAIPPAARLEYWLFALLPKAECNDYTIN